MEKSKAAEFAAALKERDYSGRARLAVIDPSAGRYLSQIVFSLKMQLRKFVSAALQPWETNFRWAAPEIQMNFGPFWGESRLWWLQQMKIAITGWVVIILKSTYQSNVLWLSYNRHEEEARASIALVTVGPAGWKQEGARDIAVLGVSVIEIRRPYRWGHGILCIFVCAYTLDILRTRNHRANALAFVSNYIKQGSDCPCIGDCCTLLAWQVQIFTCLS